MDFGAIRVILVTIVIGIIYFIPTLISLKHRQHRAIFALNLLLGWTLLGWVGALVWALVKPAEKTN